jgi:hypothetical protein
MGANELRRRTIKGSETINPRLNRLHASISKQWEDYDEGETEEQWGQTN